MTDNDYRQSVLKRLDGIEGWMKHNDETVERIDTRLTAVEGLAERVRTVETTSAVAAERERNVEKRLTGIENGVKFLIGLAVTVLVGAVGAFIIGGGLAP